MLNLYNVIKSFTNGNPDDLLKVIEFFDPLLKSLHNKSSSTETYSELILFLMELLNKLPLHKEILKENKYLISYISKSLKNYYIKLNKKSYKLYDSEFSTDLIYLYDECNEYNDFNYTIFKDLLNELTDLERQIIIYKYVHLYSDIEISKLRNVSRQSVYKTHKRALKKLKEII